MTWRAWLFLLLSQVSLVLAVPDAALVQAVVFVGCAVADKRERV